MFRRVRSSHRISPQLHDELTAERPWRHPWVIGRGSEVRLADSDEPRIEASRREMLDERLGVVLSAAGAAAVGIDLNCGEGWHAQRLLDLGAAKVLAIDDREAELRRARLLATEMRVGDQRIEFREGEVMQLRTASLGTYDVVLAFDLIERSDSPLGALKVVRALTRTVAVIETRMSGEFEEASVSVLGPDPAGELSLVPNRAAVEKLILAAGFARVEQLRPPVLGHPTFIRGERGLFLGHV